MIRIIWIALVIYAFCGTIAVAATCLSSAADVRKQQPKAWPKWTYGAHGERCWYSGKKPIFAKAPKQVRQAKAQSRLNAASGAEPASTSPAPREPPRSQGSIPQSRADGRNNNMPQSWELEYRWPK